MKRGIVFSLLFLLFGGYLFCQTWTTRSSDGNWDFEYTIIAREQWNRLLEQKKQQRPYAELIYNDELELLSSSSIVISGTRPTFNGYYYYLDKGIPRTDSARIATQEIDTTILVYGNTNTGRISISFYKIFSNGTISTSSVEFTRRYNLYIGWINGDE